MTSAVSCIPYDGITLNKGTNLVSKAKAGWGSTTLGLKKGEFQQGRGMTTGSLRDVC